MGILPMFHGLETRGTSDGHACHGALKGTSPPVASDWAKRDYRFALPGLRLRFFRTQDMFLDAVELLVVFELDDQLTAAVVALG